jgi:hypothetical protein
MTNVTRRAALKSSGIFRASAAIFPHEISHRTKQVAQGESVNSLAPAATTTNGGALDPQLLCASKRYVRGDVVVARRFTPSAIAVPGAVAHD